MNTPTIYKKTQKVTTTLSNEEIEEEEYLNELLKKNLQRNNYFTLSNLIGNLFVLLIMIVFPYMIIGKYGFIGFMLYCILLFIIFIYSVISLFSLGRLYNP